LDYATALQIAGEHKKSNEYFLKAEQLVDQLDYVSVSNVALATLGSEDQLQYKGDSYEKVLIPVMMSLNFLMLGDFESALVAVRRVNERVNKIRQTSRQNYELNPFAHQLSALIWESQAQFDNAYIAAEKAYELGARNDLLQKDLVRLARKARRPEAEKKWKELFGLDLASEELDRKKGDLIFIHQQGWGPRKDFSPDGHQFPILVPARGQTQSLVIKIKHPQGYESQHQPAPVYDLEEEAIRNFRDDYAGLVARRIAARVAKEVVADQIRQRDEVAGSLAWIAMYLSDRADLRQWSFLPQSFQILRLRLPPGTYQLEGEALSSSGLPTNETLPLREISIRAGATEIFSWRSLK
ncbi:MAG: hypothetical protein WCH11_06790, partial [Bdellovibrio sp.]